MDEKYQNEHHEFQAEYKEIRRDVKRVAISNLLFIGFLVALYFANQKYEFLAKLEKFF